MRLSYEYPALVSCVPNGLRARRNVIFMMRGEVEIPEVSPDAAPVACTIEGMIQVVYRYIDGEFYISARGSPPTDQLSPNAQYSMAFSLVREMAEGTERQAATAWPDDAQGLLWATGHDAGGGVVSASGYPSGQAEDQGDEACVYRDGKGFATLDETDLRHWSERAASLAAGHVLIDGMLWMRVSEPLLQWDNGNRLSFANRDFYAQPDNRVCRPPQPFGNVYVGPEKVSRYWRADLRCFPLTEVVDLGDMMSAAQKEEAAIYMIDVRMPEVFGNGFPLLELVRRARLAIVDARASLIVGNGWMRGVPQDMRAVYRTLRAAVDPRNAEALDGDMLADLLETFVAEWRSHIGRYLSELPAFREGALDALEMPARAVDRWRERPIAVDPSLSPVPVAKRP